MWDIGYNDNGWYIMPIFPERMQQLQKKKKKMWEFN